MFGIEDLAVNGVEQTFTRLRLIERHVAELKTDKIFCRLYQGVGGHTGVGRMGVHDIHRLVGGKEAAQLDAETRVCRVHAVAVEGNVEGRAVFQVVHALFEGRLGELGSVKEKGPLLRVVKAAAIFLQQKMNLIASQICPHNGYRSAVVVDNLFHKQRAKPLLGRRINEGAAATLLRG